jgi:hypothetical protein
MSGFQITIRPWSQFLSIQDFSVPQKADVLSDRIRANLNDWLGNYLCFVAAIVVIAGYYYRGLFIASMIATTGFAAIIFTKDMKLAVGGVAITEIHKFALTALLSLFTLYWTESFEPLLVSIAIAGVFILVHAAGKKTGFLTKAKATLESVKSDVKSKIDASKNN